MIHAHDMWFTLMTHDSIGGLQMLCIHGVLQLSSGIESEWKHRSSPLKRWKKKKNAFVDSMNPYLGVDPMMFDLLQI